MVLDRLLYRNRSQHRNAKYFTRILEVRTYSSGAMYQYHSCAYILLLYMLLVVLSMAHSPSDDNVPAYAAAFRTQASTNDDIMQECMVLLCIPGKPMVFRMHRSAYPTNSEAGEVGLVKT